MIDPKVKFSDDEVRQILARAADRQEEADRAQGKASTGLTLHHLSEIAREAGISAAHVQAAAKEIMLDRAEPSKPGLLGLPSEYTMHRVVPGPISDAQWERMVSDFRRTFKVSGITSQFGDVREWISTNNTQETMPIKIRVEPTEEGSAVTLHQSLKMATQIPMALGGSFTGMSAIVGALIALGNFEPKVFVLPILFGTIGLTTLFGGYAWAKHWTKRQGERFKALLDRIELIGRS